jgi:hypothetical protein
MRAPCMCVLCACSCDVMWMCLWRGERERERERVRKRVALSENGGQEGVALHSVAFLLYERMMMGSGTDATKCSGCAVQGVWC